MPSVARPNTWVDWYLTNNGGAQWYRVNPGTSFTFPTVGSDLRWKAELHSLSPHRSPVISQVQLTSSANNAPTLDALSPLTISEDATAQTVNLTGITAGLGESEPLGVTASLLEHGADPEPDGDVHNVRTSTGSIRLHAGCERQRDGDNHGDGERRPGFEQHGSSRRSW